MTPPSSFALLGLLASCLALHIQLVYSTTRPAVQLTGQWTAIPGESLSNAPASAHLAPDGVQVIVQRAGVTLRQTVSGLVPGNTYILSLRMTSNASASVNLVISIDRTAVTTLAVPNSNVRTGPFVAAANNELLALAFSIVSGTARIYLDSVTISPADENQTVDARHNGHIDYVVPPFDDTTHVALSRCPLNTRPCYSANATQITCCSSACGADNDPIATCHVADASVFEVAGKVAVPLGATCPPQAPNPCYNFNGQSMACCPGACGPTGGSLAVCEAGPATSSPTVSPATPPSPTDPPATPPPTGNPADPDSITIPQTSSARRKFPPRPVSTKRPVTPSSTNSPATPSPTNSAAPPVPTTAPVAPAGTILPAAPSGYRWVANPALTDEFDGNALNTSKWRASHPYWAGRLPSQFDPANVAVRGGVARLTSTTTISNLSEVKDMYNDPWVSSAIISSKAAIVGNGYYECRFKASNLRMTSAFWLQSPKTEIDVIETVGIASDYRSRRMDMNTHYYPDFIYPDRPDLSVWRDWPLPAGTGLTSGNFHTYGLWWKNASALLFYFDGQLTWQMAPAGPFTDQMYLFLDTEVFVSEGIPTVADLKDPTKNVFLVDYVRAFTLQSA